MNKASSILTPREKKLYNALLNVLPPKFLICPKVRVADLIEGEIYAPELFGRHIDFLIADKETLEPILAIECNDGTHLTERGRMRDEIVKHALHEIGVKMVGMWNPNVNMVQLQLFRSLSTMKSYSY